ncbi:MAG: hypothetical protein RMX68_014190 [Aulosira sp. ZfuVER01]|nr:hypothetical protein [Aulosira sp. ZfuVER01]MDZ8000236.1 hypothetical protein [Aulosira sp. DedVER01a]MDZ8053396.1 hypothetical protein [Aulosira sp. ZfuCHP01]
MNNLVPLSLVGSLENPIPETHSQPTYALISVHGDPTAEIGKEGAGGQNIYVRELGLALAKKGCEVDICAWYNRAVSTSR